MTDEPRIRALTRAEMDVALDWAAAEGWNPGLAAADCFRRADEAGFLGLFLARHMGASISVVAYHAAFAFFGLYIVAPAVLGPGFGLKILPGRLASPGPTRGGPRAAGA